MEADQLPPFDGDLTGLLNDVHDYIAALSSPTDWLDLLTLYVLHSHVVDTARTALT